MKATPAMPWSVGFNLNRLKIGLGPRQTLARVAQISFLKDYRSNVETDLEESSTRNRKASHVQNDKGSWCRRTGEMEEGTFRILPQQILGSH